MFGGTRHIKDNTSSKMVMISQEGGFKSFLDNQKTPPQKSSSIPTHSKMNINRKKYNKSDLPLQIAPLTTNLYHPSEVSFSDN